MSYIPTSIKLQYPNRRLYVSSRLRDSGTDSDYQINLTNAPIEIPSNKRAFLGVMKASIPNSFYPVNDTNNQLDLVCSGVDYTVTVPNGYYSAASMASTLQTLINDQVVSAEFVTVQITFDASIGKFSIASMGTAGGEDTVLLSTSPIASIIGLSSNVTNTAATDPDYSTPTVFPNLPNLNGPQSYQIRTINVNPNVWTKQEGAFSSILAVIPIAGSAFQTTIYDPVNVELNEFSTQINVLSVRITDEYGNIIDFNNQNNDLMLGVYLTDI